MPAQRLQLYIIAQYEFLQSGLQHTQQTGFNYKQPVVLMRRQQQGSNHLAPG